MDAERRFRCVESSVDVVFVRLIRAVARSCGRTCVAELKIEVAEAARSEMAGGDFGSAIFAR
jgi:hypothetical protein